MKKNIFLLITMLFLFSYCKNETKQNPTQTATSPTTPSVSEKKNIIFFGNSLTAGYGLEDISQGFVSLIQQKIDSLELPYRCINAGLSGETTSGGNDRVSWLIDQQPVSIFILELGGNDALRGINTEISSTNLQSIIDKVKTKYPTAKIVLAGMEAPRNMGKSYIQSFHDMYPSLAKKNNLTLIPFILDGVGGIKELNQTDGIHPTAQGNKIIAETIWISLKSLL